MNDYLRLKKSNCKNCYKCIRHCPVKSIRFESAQANIVSEECVLCGHCFIACPQEAKEIRDDLPAAKALLASGAPVYASVAPSFAAAYAPFTVRSLAGALARLGFAGAEETAIGATMVKEQYDEQVPGQDITISSCCHSVNLLIQRHFPRALPYLSHIMSPMQAHALDIKRRAPGAKVVFIGPCIAKKAEAESYPGTVDCALTFEELTAWLEEEKLALSYEEDVRLESRARLFPTAGGIIKTMRADALGYDYIAVDGMENCINTLKDVIAGKVEKCFIEISACAGSCINGPALAKQEASAIRGRVITSRYAGPEDFAVDSYSAEELAKKFPPAARPFKKDEEAAVREVLKKIGKTLPEHELNCGGCGYDSCREKALAVLSGKANLEMCLPFLNERAKSFSEHIIQNTPNAIIVLNKDLELQQINKAAREMMGVGSPADFIGGPVIRLLDPTPFIKVCQDRKNRHEKRVYLSEYHKYVDQSVIYDTNYDIVISIMRDVTAEVKQQESKEALSKKTIEVADKVIEKQMRAVQEIASLLGETTAETKVALTRLKESLGDE